MIMTPVFYVLQSKMTKGLGLLYYWMLYTCFEHFYQQLFILDNTHVIWTYDDYTYILYSSWTSSRQLAKYTLYV